MSLRFLTPSRCVLLIGDEALYVYNVTFNFARLLDSVPWQAENFEETVINLIRKDCAGKPVLILNDMTDQHFKGGQRLPKVGILDKSKTLSLKLQVAFPNYSIRGALAIKANKNTPKGEKKQGGLYLFVAVPMSEAVAKTLDAVKHSLASIAGFYLLPVEAADMVRTLAAKLTGKDRAPSRWVIFIGQHHNGALRQVIIRDGQLAMTRMTPVTDNTGDHEAWAQEVQLEFKATVSYLSRFGFVAEDGVDLIAVGHPEGGKALEKLIDIPCHYSTFTAPEAARELGINIGVQEDPHYADPLHAAWIGRKTRFQLPMEAAELNQIGRPRQIAAIAIFLLIMGGAYLVWSTWSQVQAMMETQSNLTTQTQNMSQASTEYDQEVKKMNELGFDVKLVQGAIATFNDFEARRPHELLMIEKIHEALGDNLRLDALNINEQETNKSADSPATAPAPALGDATAAPAKPQVKADLKLSFPPAMEVEAGVKEVNNLKRRLEAALPGCTVTIDKNVAGLEYSDTYAGEASSAAPDKKQPQQYVAEISIVGAAP